MTKRMAAPLVLASAFACFTFISILLSSNSSVRVIALIPLAFALVSPLLAYVIYLNRGTSLTFCIVVILMAVRYVLTPCISYYSGYYEGLVDQVSDRLLLDSCVSLLAELIIVALFSLIAFSSPKYSFSESETKGISLKGSPIFYCAIGVIALLIVIFFGARLNINFLFISASSGERIDETISTSDQLLSQIANSGLTFLFLTLAMHCLKRYEQEEKRKYVAFALIAALIFVCFIFGERRSGIMFACFASAVVLIRLFPGYSKPITKAFCLILIVVIGLMSIYKVSYAFLYGSYIDTLANTDFNLRETARSFDMYFGGLGCVAENHMYLNELDLGLENLVFDVTRSTFGINILLRNSGSTISEIYNSYIYSGAQSTGHLITSASYGSIYLGQAFGSLATLLNIFIASKLEGCFKRSDSVEYLYIFSYVFLRFALGVFTSFPSLWSLVSRVLVINSLIIAASTLLNKKRAPSIRNEYQSRAKNMIRHRQIV